MEHFLGYQLLPQDEINLGSLLFSFLSLQLRSLSMQFKKQYKAISEFHVHLIKRLAIYKKCKNQNRSLQSLPVQVF